MSDKTNEQTFSSFIEKARKRLDIKRENSERTLYIPSLKENIVIRGLTDAEIAEISDIEDTIEQDKYNIYLATKEPDLRNIASQLKKEGKIKQYTDIVNIIDFADRGEICRHIMRLSGITSDEKVSVVENTKN